VIRAGLQGPPKGEERRTVPRAKLGKEIGADAAHDVKPVVFNFFTNLNPMALAGGAAPRSPAHGEAVDVSEVVKQGRAVDSRGPGVGVGKEQAPPGARTARVAGLCGQSRIDDPRGGAHAERVELSLSNPKAGSRDACSAVETALPSPRRSRR